MLFNSIEYLFIFIPVVFFIYFFLNKLSLFKTAKFSLLLASLFFYGSYKLDYIWIILSSILFNYFISWLFKLNLSENKKKLILFIGISGNIAILLFFKYFDFLAQALGNFGIDTFSAFKIIMPLGISFFTLQEISFLIDCYKGDLRNYNILDFALFVCFFPQFVAGPVVRHQEMIPQFNDPQNKYVNHKNIFFALFIITIGLLKKTVLSDGFSNFTDRISYHDSFFNGYLCWFYSIIKLLQAYFDFSGYCDIAIGSAILFNIKIPWNFNSPYKAQNISDFWNRWNMTIVRFFKDYIYTPMGADKKGTARTYFNIIFLFFLYGAWMGLQAGCIIYGLLNGIFICINKLWQKLNIKMNKVFATGLTFFSLILTIPFLSAKSLSQTFSIFQMMFNLNFSLENICIEGYKLVFTDIRYLPYKFPYEFNYFLLIIALCLVFFSKNSTELAEIYVNKNNKIYTILLLVLFIISILSITRSTEFLYFVF